MSGIGCGQCGKPATVRYVGRAWHDYEGIAKPTRVAHAGRDLYLCGPCNSQFEAGIRRLPGDVSPFAVPVRQAAS